MFILHHPSCASSSSLAAAHCDNFHCHGLASEPDAASFRRSATAQQPQKSAGSSQAAAKAAAKTRTAAATNASSQKVPAPGSRSPTSSQRPASQPGSHAYATAGDSSAGMSHPQVCLVRSILRGCLVQPPCRSHVAGAGCCGIWGNLRNCMHASSAAEDLHMAHCSRLANGTSGHRVRVP